MIGPLPRKRWIGLALAPVVLVIALFALQDRSKSAAAPPATIADQPAACTSCDARHKRATQRITTPKETTE